MSLNKIKIEITSSIFPTTIVQNYKSIIRKLEKKTQIFYLETNKIGSTVFKNLWDAAKAIPRGRSRVI